jgi:type I restriction enzyme M protein
MATRISMEEVTASKLFIEVPAQSGNVPKYAYIAGPHNNDIRPARTKVLENKIKRTHSIIWSGGKRDPLMAFDEWSKLLFAKVEDERNTPNDAPRRFQVGSNETTAVVAGRVHDLFERACASDHTIFPEGTRIDLPDPKMLEVVKVLQDISIVSTGTDAVGAAFEGFFGSVFRGELGQYFTMRQVARFVVAVLDISHEDYVIDPTAGSGGFLLEVLLQVWLGLDARFAGRDDLARLKSDFALLKVYGIEIHEVLARICKINLLLHHDGHTNIEGNRSCLDSVFHKEGLTPWRERFTKVVGNPPFGDEVKRGDEDLLGSSSLSDFAVAAGRSSVASEHAIVERAVELLSPGGSLGLVLPDGLFNNQGEISNCPSVRRFLAMNGRFEAIVSLPDHAFRKSGAQNKTSILFFRKYSEQERAKFDRAYAGSGAGLESHRIADALAALDYRVFLAEANHIGYAPSGAACPLNDLYEGREGGHIDAVQEGTILGDWRRFSEAPADYEGGTSPDSMAITAVEMWRAHRSNRLDPKYHLFKHAESAVVPDGWTRVAARDVMRRRETRVRPELNPERAVKVLTVTQTGDLRLRAAGKGNTPPEWLGMYFEGSLSKWFGARTGDVVFSSIDLWKGCIAVVGEDFDGGLVTKEFPIYEIVDDRLDPDFLSCLLRSRFYQRAFRAITTGHSNRRRTQVEDFEDLEICFPTDKALQIELVRDVLDARGAQRSARSQLREAMARFSAAIDGRVDDEF